MTDPIRTPETHPDKPIPFFYPPILPGRVYHAATYPGHSNGAIDMNRRSPTGAWLQDLGDPVLAAQDGRVAELDRTDGLVVLNHGDGWRTAYRHMQTIHAKLGAAVQRGDQLGEVGNKAGSGSSFGPHLHFVVTKDGQPRQVRFMGQSIATSVLDSDTRPPTWVPPEPVEVIGAPARATWEGAYREAAKRLEKLEERIAAKDGRIALLKGELDDCLASQPTDRDQIIADRDAAMAALALETDRAVAAEAIIEAVRRAVR